MSAEPPLPVPDPVETLATEAIVAEAGKPRPAPSHPEAPAETAPHAVTHGHSAGNTHCLNCGTPLNGPFCHACGQHDFDSNRSFWHTLLEALENFFHFEGKFFRNIVTLLFRPGRLTADFNAGKRASQMPPFRLYVFTAFVFFLWAFSTDRRTDLLRVDGGNSSRPPAAASATPAPSAAVNQPHVTLKPVDKPAEEMSSPERWFSDQMERMANPEVHRKLSQSFLTAIPKLLLFCLPLFALYARVLYRGSGQNYLQHLIMALHFHTFIFLWMMFSEGWVWLAHLPGEKLGAVVKVLLDAWLVLYPVLMLRRLHRQSWPRTLGKTFALALAYLCTLPAVFFAALILLLMML